VDPTVVDTLLDAGVSVGGVILGALLGYGASARQAKKQADEEAVARAYDLFFTVHRIVNQVLGFQRQLRLSIRPPSPEDTQDHLSARLQPIMGVTRETERIDPRALSILTRAGDFEFITCLMELVDHHAILCDLLIEYARKREELYARITPVAMDGLVGTVQFEDEAELLAILAPLRTLDDLARQLLECAESAARRAIEINGRLSPLLKQATGAKKFPTTSRPDEAQLFGPATP
jgi:hypothetical protein